MARILRRDIDRKAALIVALFTVVVSGVLVLALVGLDTLSAVRAYVAGESRWSKARREATQALRRYAETGDRGAWSLYEEAVAIPLGDRIAREELERADYDRDRAARGFIQGRNHPDDVARMIRFFRWFRTVSHVDSAIVIWARGDSLIGALRAQAARLDSALDAGAPSTEVTPILEEIDRIDRALLPLEYAFSDAMGEGARWAGRVVVTVLVASGTVLLLGGAGVTLVVLHRLRTSEEALAASEEQYRTLVEDASLGIGRSTADGKVVAANPALVEMLGYRSERELLALDLTKDLHGAPGGREQVVAEFATAGVRSRSIETRWKRRDGQWIDVRIMGRARHGDDGSVQGYDVIVEDITEQKALEDQLRQAQKMEAVGQLTGGIAHDLNNVLTAILANADLIASAVEPVAPEVRADIAELQGAARRGAQMIRKLLAFSRRERLERTPRRLDDLVREMTTVLRRVLPEHIEIRLDTEQDLPHASVDAGAVEQMLVNLATNARDTMPHGGTLGIGVRRRRLDQRQPRHGELQLPGDYVCIDVHDTGAGMDGETRERVFEPFFTTKSVGAGTGLGLAMVYGLMRQHEGHATVESELGAGTTVTLWFPASDEQPPAGDAVENGVDRTAVPGRGETILLVEDEVAVRRSAARVLERLGYRVLQAEHGAQALELIDAQAGAIDLVVSDVIMPVMGGPAMYEEMRRRELRLPILFMSGYTDRDAADRTGLTAGLPFLEKPWTPVTLAERVRELLDRRRGRRRAT